MKSISNEEEVLHNRVYALQQFLECICSNFILKHSVHLQNFLTEQTDISSHPKPPCAVPQPENFISEKEEPFRVTNMMYPTATINLVMNTTIRAVLREVDTQTDHIKPIEDSITKLCSAVMDSYDLLAKNLGELQKKIAEASAVYKELDTATGIPNFGVVRDLYSELSHNLREVAKGKLEESKIIFESVKPIFEFSSLEWGGLERVKFRI